jgi:ParB family transcriptional regulator, chromosome partitioning protein
MKRKGGLGRGLDALIPSVTEEGNENKTQNVVQNETENNSVKETPDETSKKNKNSEIITVKPENKKKIEKGSAAEKNTTDLKSEINKSETQGDNPNLVTIVRITKVEPDRNQPRKSFDEEKLQELADSIQSKGLIEPIIVQKQDDHYEIIAGERRWRACKLAGLKEIPVIVKEYDNLERVEISLIENIQRENLNPIEEANAYRRLIDEFHLKQDELAERVSKNRSSIANTMRLLKLTDKVQSLVADGKLSMGHARALLALENAEQQENLANEIIEKNLSVRDVEKKIRSLLQKKEEKKTEKDPSLVLIYQDIQNKMNAALGMKVAIKDKGNSRGSIEISYENQDDFEKLMDKIMN